MIGFARGWRIPSKGPGQLALLGLDSGDVRAAQYLTEPIREALQRRLAAIAEGATGETP
jgi:hypothetical protein